MKHVLEQSDGTASGAKPSKERAERLTAGGEQATGQTRRYQRARKALATTLAQEATQSFEAPSNRGVRTRVKTNTDTQSGAPRPGMLPAGIRPGAELKSNEMGGIAAGDAPRALRDPDEMRARGPRVSAAMADPAARASIRREAEVAREDRQPLGRDALSRVPLRRDPLRVETRYLGRPKDAPGAGRAGAGAGVGEAREEGHGGWIAAMVLAIVALGASIYVAFGR